MNCLFSLKLHDLCMHVGYVSLSTLVTIAFDSVAHDSLLISHKLLVFFLSNTISTQNN